MQIGVVFVVTNRDNRCYKSISVFIITNWGRGYYKLEQALLLQIGIGLLQLGTGITQAQLLQAYEQQASCPFSVGLQISYCYLYKQWGVNAPAKD